MVFSFYHTHNQTSPYPKTRKSTILTWNKIDPGKIIMYSYHSSQGRVRLNECSEYTLALIHTKPLYMTARGYFCNKLDCYLYHRLVLKNLQPGEAVVIVDYKMKLELGMRSREIQRDWYGKRGISLHGFYVIAQVDVGERRIEVLDLWCEDTTLTKSTYMSHTCDIYCTTLHICNIYVHICYIYVRSGSYFYIYVTYMQNCTNENCIHVTYM